MVDWGWKKRPDGSWRCKKGRGPACHRSIFLPPFDSDDELIRLTNQVNELSGPFIDSRPGLTLRILADTEGGENADQLRFAYVEMVSDDAPDPD